MDKRGCQTIKNMARTARASRTMEANANKAKRSSILLISTCIKLWATRRPTYNQARPRLRPEASPITAKARATA